MLYIIYTYIYIYPERREPIQNRFLSDFLAKAYSGFKGPIEETWGNMRKRAAARGFKAL